MKFSDIMDYYYDDYEEPFNRWVNRQYKLWRFPPWRVFDYFLLAVKASVLKDYDTVFPDFKSWHSIRWTLRHAITMLVRD